MTEQPITVIVNSGATPQKRRQLGEQIADAFKEAGLRANIVILQKRENCTKRCAVCVVKAKETGGIVIAAGGDGTVNTIARLCHEHKVRLGIIPLGTFNYFARELNIPLTLSEAVAVIAKGASRKATIGVLQNHIFLNNASFGLYSRLIRHREQASSSFGRWRIVAALTAAYTLLSLHKAFRITVASAGSAGQVYRTSMVFIGNNTLQLENLGLGAARCTKERKLAMIVMKKNTRWDTARLLLRGIIGNLKDESKLEELCSENFTVEIDRASIDVVIDGEIVRCPAPLHFHVARDALDVIAPPVKETSL